MHITSKYTVHLYRCLCLQLPWSHVGRLLLRHIQATRVEVSVSQANTTNMHRDSELLHATAPLRHMELEPKY